MAKFRMVRTDFWKNPIVSEEMTPEDKYFLLYLLTNPDTTQTGIYRITKKQMAFDLGYSIESVNSLMERMEQYHEIIRYNPKTRELAIKNWGKYNLQKGGKPVMDCIASQLKEVEDTSLIQYVAEHIDRDDILAIYESFCEKEDEPSFQVSDVSLDDTLTTRTTIRGQKEKEEEKEKQQQEKEAHDPMIENEQDGLLADLKSEAVKEIITFWDQNGFGLSNVNGKEQLLCWLDDSRFLHPKDVILKALQIACSTNKRRLSYVVGILKNWENESLLTIEEIELHNANARRDTQETTEKRQSGRDVPSDFKLDLSAGEDW